MTCHEFTKQIEGLSLAELSFAGDAELLAHPNGCPTCAALLQQQNALAGAMQALRSRTAALQAPSVVEQNVLRAFRQNTTIQPPPMLAMKSRPAGFRLRDFLGWRAYAAVAAVLAIGLGLGLWFAQHSTAQRPTAKIEQPAQPSVTPTEEKAQLPVQALASNPKESSSETTVAALEHPARVSVTQSEQAQGYTPLMLCDPISCSGDAEVVRMELPTTTADGSAATQMADVIVGDDGLVRAIRIVQQQ